MTDVDEVTLKQWIESTWFKGAARLVMILGGLLLMFGGPLVGWAIYQTKDDLVEMNSDVNDLNSRLTILKSRVDVDAADSQEFEDQVLRSLNRMTLRLDSAVQTIGNVEGIVQQMNRRDTAVGFSTGSIPDGR